MPQRDNAHRILVIDDNPAIAEDFRKILCPEGGAKAALGRAAALLFEDEATSSGEAPVYSVDSATQGRDGLEMIREAAAANDPYAMAFVDIRMPPGWDGVETTSHIWREFPDLQIVICTAFSDYSWEETVARLGYSDRLFILNKPFDVSEVRQLVMAITTRRKAEEEAREAQETAERLNKAQAEALLNSARTMEALRESEARNRAIVEHAAEGIVLVDERGTIQSFNPAAERIFGYSSSEICGQKVTELMPPDVAKKHDLAFYDLLAASDEQLEPITQEAVGVHKDGRQLNVLVGVSEVRHGEGRHFTALIHDITDRKAAEEQSAIFRRFAEASSQGFGMADLDCRITYVNPTLATWLDEESPDDVIGRSILTCYPDDLQTRVTDEVIPIVLKEGHWTGESAFRDAKGNLIPVQESIFLLRDENGNPHRIANVVTDMTQQKMAKQELQGYARALESANSALQDFCQKAEEASNAKSAFLANMSHELRTPIHGVLSFATFGQKKIETADREELGEYFVKIEKSGKVLLDLVNDVLDLAKLEAGKMTFEFAQVDLFSLVKQVADEFTSTIAHRRISIVCPAPDFDTSIIADGQRLMQVIRNLLSNAVRFSSDESTIEVVMKRSEQSLSVAVLDQGVGIPESELEEIFDKFVQSSKTRTGAGGTGLGLSICREIVDSHQGLIWARNRPEGGAAVTFSVALNPNSSTDSPEQTHQSPPITEMETAEVGDLTQQAFS